MNKLPIEIYQSMMSYDEGKYRQKNKRYLLGKKICDDEEKYRTLDIISYKKNINGIGITHHYKITFRDYYRLSGVIGNTKIIHMNILDDEWTGYTRIRSKYQQIIDYICKVMKIETHKYDSFNIYHSISNTANTTPNDDYWLWKRSSKRRIHFICKDLNFEELDSIIYPEEYENYIYSDK